MREKKLHSKKKISMKHPVVTEKQAAVIVDMITNPKYRKLPQEVVDRIKRSKERHNNFFNEAFTSK